MLSDLDQRQAGNSDTVSGNPEYGTPQIAAVFPLNKRPSRSYIKYAFYSIVILLLSAITWFSYSIYSRTQQTAAVNNAAPAKPQTVKKVVTQQQKSKPRRTQKTLPLTSAKNVATDNTLKKARLSKRVDRPVPVQVPVTGLAQRSPENTEQPVTTSVSESSHDMQNNAEISSDISAVQKQNYQLSPRQLAEVTYQKGYQLLNQNKVYSAEVKLQLALEHDPKHIKAREMLTALYLRMGRKVEAAEVLAKGLLYVPGYSNFAKLQARLFIDNNKVDRAVTTLLKYKPALSADPDYYALLAASYQRQKNHAAAAGVYVKLLKQKPREGIWWVGMAISLEALGKTKQARDAYEKARQTGTLNPLFSDYSSQRLKQLQAVGESE